MGAMEDVPSRAEAIDINQARAKSISYSFCPVPRALISTLTSDPNFDFSKRELKLIMYVMGRLLGHAGDPTFFTATDTQLAKALSIDLSNMKKTLLELVAQKILIRDGDRIGVNVNSDTWEPAGIIKKAPRTGQNNQSKLVKTTSETGQNNQSELVETTSEDWLKQPVGLVKTTSPTPPSPADGADRQTPKDMTKTIDLRHGEEKEDLSSLGEKKDGVTETSIVSEWSVEVRATAKLLMSEGYLLAANGKAVGPDNLAMAVAKYEAVVNNRLRKAQDDGIGMEAVLYMREVLQPVIKACPAKFRAHFGQWSQQLNFCLKLCREAGGFVDMWADEAKAKAEARPDRGMAPVSDFSHLEGGTRSVEWD